MKLFQEEETPGLFSISLEILIELRVRQELARREPLSRVHVRTPHEEQRIIAAWMARHNARYPGDHQAHLRLYRDSDGALRETSAAVGRRVRAMGIVRDL